ncbi:MAG: circularly permuted type 2 ATP-grasp protein [Myxococcales bacterium]|nr:circularly permuted type 2 ATP-grasp protein [Myxococcales bacterium]
MILSGYDTGGFYDEIFATPGLPRPGGEILLDLLRSLPDGELRQRQAAAETTLLQWGITFSAYGEEGGIERIFPFDIVPRVIEAAEWRRLERGLSQRMRALNLFIDDVYHDRQIVKDGVVPAWLIDSSKGYLPQCQGFNPPRGVWCHINGTDLVRDVDGTFHVLEDNLRCPSGVSYVIENRAVLKRIFPHVFRASCVRPVDDYPARLLATLQAIAPEGAVNPRVVVLTPGIYNSAYYEHCFLAGQMGVDVVEGRDLVVRDGFVHMRTTHGFDRVDVIYRRIDDAFLDPKAFRPDSMLGVPGIMEVYKAGRVALANAPGTGVADDKAIYAYVPKIIEYYLAEEPILPNVPTYVCAEPDECAHVLDNLADLVVKCTDEAGGYGMLVGPHATEAQRDIFAKLVRATPRKYIAQPTLGLSRAPVLVDDHLEGRHVDLRPYCLFGGDEPWILPGGLTRVALRKGSLVVNSSQGGGSKDTWVLADDLPSDAIAEDEAAAPSRFGVDRA